MDSPCAGGIGKTLEMYVDGTLDLTDWTIETRANANNFPGSVISLADLGTITDSFIYATNSSETFIAEFGITSNVIESNSIEANGNDGFQIVDNNANVVDRFSEDGVDGTGTAWEYLDTYFYRKDLATPNGGSFDVANWTFGALNSLDGEGLCRGANALSTLVPFGSYESEDGTASTDSNSIEGFNVYPNPVASEFFTVSSANSNAKEIVVFNILGEQVLTKNSSGLKVDVNISGIASGIYLLKVIEDGKVSTQKIIIE